MKKRILTLMTLALMLVCGKALAQDCSAIVAPLVQHRGINLDNYPHEKYMYWCVKGHSFFYFADEAPANAKVFSLTDVIEIATREHISSTFVPDLNSFSYYAYNFADIQIQFNNQTLYFRLPEGSGHAYLALRSFVECEDVTMAELAKLRAKGEYDNK